MKSREDRMSIARFLALIITATAFLPRATFALPWKSYAQQHASECAAAWARKTDERALCGGRQFCTAHGNDDRISRIVCDPYVSKADRRLDSITVTQARLATARDLNALEMLARCQPDYITPTDRDALRKPEIGFGDILPGGMKAARLGLCAAIQLGPFPATIVKIGIGAAGAGWMEVTWNRNGTGARETHTVRLNPAEIDHLLAFVGTSQCAFIRNGTSYPPAEAREHLSGKLKYAKARISTAEEFIRHLATESSMSGEPYRVKCDGKVIPAGVWLADELQRFRKVAAAGAPAKAQ